DMLYVGGMLIPVVITLVLSFAFFFSSRRRHTRSKRDWSSDVCSSDLYERIDCDAEQLPTLVDSSPGDRIGYSVTMPGKFAALGHASVVSDRARIVGSANTLVRHADGWYADCTDVDGATGALAAFGDLPARPAAVVLGVGGTARPVLAGLAALGGVRVVLASRRDNAGPAADCG